MSDLRVLQRLLSGGEYDELEDIVIVEGQFIEVDETGIGFRQMNLGLTPEFLLMAEHQIYSYKENPEIYYRTDIDPLLDGLEMTSVFPLCLVDITAFKRTYGITVTFYDRRRYFEMANTRMNGDLEELWYRWLERIEYLHEDPYGYLRALYDRYKLPYPSYLRTTRDDTVENLIVSSKDVKSSKLALRSIQEVSEETKIQNVFSGTRRGGKYAKENLEDVNENQEKTLNKNKHNNNVIKLCCV